MLRQLDASSMIDVIVPLVVMFAIVNAVLLVRAALRHPAGVRALMPDTADRAPAAAAAAATGERPHESQGDAGQPARGHESQGDAGLPAPGRAVARDAIAPPSGPRPSPERAADGGPRAGSVMAAGSRAGATATEPEVLRLSRIVIAPDPVVDWERCRKPGCDHKKDHRRDRAASVSGMPAPAHDETALQRF
jgi:hypothetical protein